MIVFIFFTNVHMTPNQDYIDQCKRSTGNLESSLGDQPLRFISALKHECPQSPPPPGIPTVNLAERLVCVDRGVFSGTAEVSARGHDLGV